MIDPLNALWLLPPFVYAETHYRFPFFFSLLKKNEPEVIADIPHRIEPRHDLPILILVKDAHLYPCVLKRIRVEFRRQGKIARETDLLRDPIVLNQRLFSIVFPTKRDQLSGWVDIDVTFTLEVNGATSVYHNDNHVTSSRRPLRVYLSDRPIPCFPELYLGDPHTHSSYTEDQVEFGSPLSASRELGRAMGLSFFCATDHSYDLDDKLDSFLENDPALPKWVAFQKEVASLNENSDDFTIVRGEEVSCRNSEGKNVHFLLIGQKEFIPGSGDGAEQWFRTKSEHTIGEVIARKSTGAITFAAHAQEPVPFLQRYLLGRGSWSLSDLQNEGLTGLQIINGKLDIGFERSYRVWIHMLLSGRRVCAIAGNDAHGNFNRFRQIGIPFFKIHEAEHQLFGRWRTGVFVASPLSEKSMLESLTGGRAIMTDGPVVEMAASSPAGNLGGIGDTVYGESIRFEMNILSSEEFGEINSIRVIVGKVRNTAEQTALRFEGNQGFQLHKDFTLEGIAASYVRIEVATSGTSSGDGKTHFCFTNPIWLESGA